ncbi:MAG: hypothetical protein KY475_22095 [Planctomycetes bacterium]|nr:hypothetical protein [Planctomycetota bacterium]
MARLWPVLRHRLLGLCDWDGCRCRICRVPRQEGHVWEGCKCQHCPQTRHEWEHCHCRRCGGQRHEWQGLVCRSCGVRKDLAVLLREHFPKKHAAIEQVLAKLNEAPALDWSTIYDWQVVELTRSAIPCHDKGVDYDLEVASQCLLASEEEDRAPRSSTESSGYVAPAALRIKRRDGAPSQVFV